MKHWSRVVCVMALLVVSAHAWADNPFLRGPDERRWEPVPDSVFLQETGAQVEMDSPALSVAVFYGDVFISTEDGVYSLAGDNLMRVPQAPGGIHRMRVVGGALWGMAESGLYRYNGFELEKLSDEAFVDVCELHGAVHAATTMDVYRYENGALVPIEPEDGFKSTNITYMMEDGTQILHRRERFGPISRIDAYSETLYGLRSNGLVLLDGDVVDPRTVDWGLPPSYTLRDMLAVGNRMYIATDRGLAVLRGMALTTLDGKDGLPYEDVTCLGKGFDNDMWIGTTWGAIRKVGDDFHYFAGERWLPDNHVHDIAVDDQTVYVATDKGIGIIRYIPYTLRKKADYYERRLEEWGHKRMGFTHLLLYRPEHGGWIREITDNDGGYTSHYLVAMMYKYAVTGDEDALQEAIKTLNALIWLEEITPIDGFPARAIWSVEGDAGQQATGGSGGLPARWNPAPDGKFEWKGDTSSDEVGAHFYAMAVFYELAPDGPEKDRARRHIDRLTRHIVDNGWKLRDMGGELTRWGRWDPEYLQRLYGMYARGLNGMEAQAFAYTAIGMLGDEYFQDALDQLIEWRYHDHTVRQKLTFPPNYITTWDDRLAFMSYYSLLRFSEPGRLRSLYMRSLERSWEVKRIENDPWYNFLYGMMTGNECEAEEAVQVLREWPLDLILYQFRNSHRRDLYPEPGYTPYAQGPRTNAPKSISPRESQPKKADGTLLTLDGGAWDTRTITPNIWLESYWKGRYYGFIEAPEADAPDLIAVADEPLRQRGAAPYEGPLPPYME